MTDHTTLTVNGVDINYVNTQETKGIRVANASTICFFTLVLAISMIILWLYISDNQVISELSRYTRIKNAVKGWKSLVYTKSSIESDYGKQLVADRQDLFAFQCVDFGAYFLPIRIDRDTFLPQAIRRGEGDGWKINKADKIDKSSQQFCEFIISRYSNNTITCGNDMMKKIGYSGYFEHGHWCSQYHGLLS
ncbi:Entry/fusion IMV membrane protein [Sea otter poxvirus]|uniref:Entry/fusion IMV membrane protein n=1 Tax=Sea otter poxvirus TaxID=1416741 RepID=A0A2U9QHQ1_9POXV|nr:Entry/fusion IMV membrane protein [Sea otter poxvirus]AWU47116.1 Entry/fusion IMV membrane protein [Sea otter poxvirus]